MPEPWDPKVLKRDLGEIHPRTGLKSFLQVDPERGNICVQCGGEMEYDHTSERRDQRRTRAYRIEHYVCVECGRGGQITEAL